MVEIRLLGGFGVTVDGGAIPADAWSHRRAAELVQLLALADGHRLVRDQVLEALWPHLEPDAAASNLHKAAHHARAALGQRDGIVLRAGAVAMFPERDVAVDAATFLSEARSTLAAGDAAAADALLDRHHHDLLPDARYEDWAAPARDQVQRQWVELSRLTGRWDDLIEVDPADEDAHRELMQAHLDAGNVHAAVRQYGRLTDALSRELGVGPSPATEALYRESVDALARPQPAPVGRDVELVRLRAAIREAAHGAARALLLRGDPGMGKTTLCRQLVELAEDEGLTAVMVTADPEAAQPYAPLAEAVDRLIADHPDALAALPRPIVDVLATLTPAIASPPGEPASRQRTLLAIGRLLDEVAGDRGLLIGLDDAHAADDATLDALHHIARRLGDTGTVVVLAFRPLETRPELEAVRGALISRGGIELDLAPLTREETQVLVGRVAGHDAAPEHADAVCDLAGGNPFFTVELARGMTASGELAVPDTLWDSIAVSFSGLDEGTLAALDRLAVTAASFDADVVSAVTGSEEAKAFALLDRAITAGVLVVEGGGYRFRHQLVREALARRVPPHRQAEIHRDAAARLERQGGPPVLIAHHWLSGGDPERAVPFLLDAAAQAAGLAAWRDALHHVDAVLTHEPDQVEAKVLRADLLFALGDPGALAAYAEAGNVAEGPTRTAVRIRHAWALLTSGQVPPAFQALDGLEPESPQTELAYHLTRGVALSFAGDVDASSEAADRASQLAMEVGAPGPLVDAAMLQGMVAHDRGDWPARIRQDILRTSKLPDLAARLIDGHLCMAEAWLYGSEPYDEVVDFARDLGSEAERLGAARGRAFATTLLGEALLLSGDVAAAERELRLGGRLHHELGAACGEALSLQRLAQAAVLDGRAEEAEPLLAEALDVARASPLTVRHLLQRIHGTRVSAAPDPDAAIEAVGDAEAAIVGPFESCPFCGPAFWTPAAIATAGAGEVERARQYTEMAAASIGAVWDRGGWVATLAETRGHVAMAEGDTAAATEHFRTAEGEFRRAGQPLDAERCARLLPAVSA